MAENIQIVKTIYGKTTYKNVIDTEFNQLVPKPSAIQEKTPATVDTFFQDYNNLFYDIPPSGSDNSNLGLVQKSSEYIGISYDDLLEEIRILRDENVSLKTQLFSLTVGNT
jgi:hypothetical protein